METIGFQLREKCLVTKYSWGHSSGGPMSDNSLSRANAVYILFWLAYHVLYFLEGSFSNVMYAT